LKYEQKINDNKFIFLYICTTVTAIKSMMAIMDQFFNVFVFSLIKLIKEKKLCGWVSGT